jgi:hypothetical protein
VSDDDGGGGGGGGYYGGGGGAGEDDNVPTDGGGGGGGGSGFGPASPTFESGVQQGTGFVEISYTVDPGCDVVPTTTARSAVTPAQPAAATAATPAFTG